MWVLPGPGVRVLVDVRRGWGNFGSFCHSPRLWSQLLLARSPIYCSLDPALALLAVLRMQTGSLSWCCMPRGRQGLGGPAQALPSLGAAGRPLP